MVIIPGGDLHVQPNQTTPVQAYLSSKFCPVPIGSQEKRQNVPLIKNEKLMIKPYRQHQKAHIMQACCHGYGFFDAQKSWTT